MGMSDEFIELLGIVLFSWWYLEGRWLFSAYLQRHLARCLARQGKKVSSGPNAIDRGRDDLSDILPSFLGKNTSHCREIRYPAVESVEGLWISDGGISTFAQDLESSGFFDLNPDAMRNNCVSVTLAKILRYEDVGSLWDDVYGRYSKETDGIPVHMLEDTRGLHCNEVMDLFYHTRRFLSWYEYTPDRKDSSNPDKYTPMSYYVGKYPPVTDWYMGWGAMYFFQNEEGKDWGHCVVADLENMKFTCYQHCPSGFDVTDQVNKARKVILFSVAKATIERSADVEEHFGFLEKRYPASFQNMIKSFDPVYWERSPAMYRSGM